MVQEVTKLCGKVLEHKSIVICVFQIPYLFLRAERDKMRLVMETHGVKYKYRASKHRGTYLVFDFPPRQLTDREFNQHVEEGPQVVMATHLLQITRHICE